MTRLWDKGEPLDALVLRYTAGEDHRLDDRLVPHDVRASIAHAEMLHAAGHLAAEDLEAVRAALVDLAGAHARGEWTVSLEEEDVHTALENRLVAAVGEAGKRIHLGRSRNDQVLAALRLYMKDAAREVGRGGRQVVLALARLGEEQGSVPLPGYTHGQRAMPSSVTLWAGGFRAEIEDDLLGVGGSMRRMDKNPLGSAAGYGAPLPGLDREATRKALGFAAVHDPVTAVQLSRGKAEAGFVFELCLLMQDLGRLAADICLFATAEFGFLKLPEAFTTGSSIMPQKRNPDVFELVRARAAILPSELQALLAVSAKMPSGYHRDLQAQKAPLFRAVDTTLDTLAVMGRALPGLVFDTEAVSAAMDRSLSATEEAYRLAVERNVPFRDAYARVAAGLRRP
jgi:argininosuccinate lyase